MESFEQSLRDLIRDVVKEAVREVLTEKLVKEEPEADPFVSVQQAADHAGVSPSWILREAQAGRLVSFRAGRLVRIRIADVARW